MHALDRVAASNHLLASLPATVRTRVLASCESVDLPLGEVLFEPGSLIRHVYFPIDSFVSLISSIDEVGAIEVGLVGNEGMCGASLALGVDASALKAVVQGGGGALRMTAAAFRRECRRDESFRRMVDRYLYVVLSQVAQSASCTRFHVVEARLARWLLMTQDRAGVRRFHITHKFLAWMLGVRRAGVTNAASALQAKHLITYHRGDISILNRRGLEAAACPCYDAQKLTYETVLGSAARA